MKTKAITTIIITLFLASMTFNVAQGVPSAPEIARGVFVTFGYNSPPWYPPEEETDSYKWAPKYYWAVPSVSVKVSPTSSGFPKGKLYAVVAEVEKGFEVWDAASGPYSVEVSRDDKVSPSLLFPDGVNTISWGVIDGPGGIITVTYFWYYVATKELIDCDTIFDTAEPWSISEEVPSDKFDVWNTAAHEAGHFLVLQDLSSPKDGALTMHAYTWLGDDVKRDLGSGDTLGVQAIYGV